MYRMQATVSTCIVYAVPTIHLMDTMATTNELSPYDMIATLFILYTLYMKYIMSIMNLNNIIKTKDE